MTTAPHPRLADRAGTDLAPGEVGMGYPSSLVPSLVVLPYLGLPWWLGQVAYDPDPDSPAPSQKAHDPGRGLRWFMAQTFPSPREQKDRHV